MNDKNRYNQNYRGVYCTCNRPYPDGEDPVPDAMIQCAICEDWFHRRHLKVEGQQPPCDSAFAELICHLCSEKYHESFLFAYQGFSVCNIDKKGNEELDVNLGTSEENNISIDKSTNSEDLEETCSSCTISREASTDQMGENEEGKSLVDSDCIVKAAKHKLTNLPKPVSLFMLQGWRKQLCKCPDCRAKYQERNLDFLLNSEDTVHHYEKKAEPRNRKSSQYEDGMKALSEMDRSNQIEAIHAYNSMKSNLMEYLEKFAENKKVVREEDIQEFFQQMSGNKRMKMTPPDSCK